MTQKQKRAINNLREAWRFYKQCKAEKGSGAPGALQDAVEWRDNAIQELLDCTGYYRSVES